MLARLPPAETTMRTLLLSMFLLLSGALPAHAQKALPGLTEGVEYRYIADGAPYRPRRGTLEVAEIFAYSCHHCANIEPLLNGWKRTLPKGVGFVALPLVNGPEDPWGRAFFAAEASKALPTVHPLLFKAVHESGQLAKAPTLAQLNDFIARVPGIDQRAYKASLGNDAKLRAQLTAAREFALKSNIAGTPSLVVGGRYLVLGNSYENLLANARRVVDALLARAAPPPAAKPGS